MASLTKKTNKDKLFLKNNRTIISKDAQTLKKILTPYKEDHHILLDFIYYCYEENIKESSVRQIIQSLTGEDCWISYYKERVNQIYTKTSPLDPLGYTGLMESLQETELNNLTNLIQQPIGSSTLEDYIASDKTIIVDRRNNTVSLKHEKQVKMGADWQDRGRSEIIINAAPIRVTIIDSPITDAPRDFNIQWRSNLSGRPFTTSGEKGSANINEIATYLENAGYSPNPRNLKGAVSSVINCFQREGLAIVKEEVENPGFFYNSEEDRIIINKFSYTEPTLDELKEAVQVISDIGTCYLGREVKLASVLKWAWLSAFSYILKQFGNWMPWLYLHGQAGSGKTTLGKIALYCWGTPNEKNETGGSSFDSEYKVGMILSQSTFPHLINEPLGLFQKRGVFEMLKTSVEHTIARSKSINGVYTQIPAFTPIIFTANQPAPQDDAFLRRTYRIPFYYNERNDEQSKKDFKKKFNVENPRQSPLNALQYISNYFICKICDDPSILQDDWMIIADKLLKLLESEYEEIKLPTWIYQWQETESLEDYDDDQREMLRMFFLEKINEASKKITIMDKNGIATLHEPTLTDDDYDLINNDDYESRSKYVISRNLIPWMFLKQTKGQLFVCVTKGIKKDLHEVTQTCSELKSLCLLLGWRHISIRKTGSDSPQMMGRVLFKEFVEWIYMKDYVED